MIVEQKPLGENENLAIVAMLADAPFKQLMQVVQGRVDHALIQATEDLHDSVLHPRKKEDGEKHLEYARLLQSFLDVCNCLTHEAASQTIFSTVEIKPTPAK